MKTETKKRPTWVQLELFPEMAKTRGGGEQSVTNEHNIAK